ncbi:AfsR/SARP family transcriptional regulator [Nonomuraea typhae]|uniref:AfsR/SARP family transcriptional regulator n=1 Tax=Nonomuraea typhae TaxID=2603600 RepID=UPI0012F81027|nr:AfsR/SARP family transcriptional regulator [Nonomuraea typhae]
MIEIRLLGSLHVEWNGADCTPTAPKMRQVLSLLALSANRPLSDEALIEELWSGSPPVSSMTTLQTYVYHLRKMLSEEMIVRVAAGYALRLDEQAVDAFRFERLVQEGRAALAAAEPQVAHNLLGQALALWIGEHALAGAPQGTLLRAEAVHLEEVRMNAQELRIDAALRLGDYGAQVCELKRLTTRYPLNESLHGKLMLALYKAGRRNDALQWYRQLRLTIREELGLEPSDDIRRLHAWMLGDRPHEELVPELTGAPASPSRAAGW